MDKLFAGISLIVFGIIAIFDPILQNPINGMVIDLTGFEKPFGILCIAFGFAFLWVFYKTKKIESED